MNAVNGRAPRVSLFCRFWLNPFSASPQWDLGNFLTSALERKRLMKSALVILTYALCVTLYVALMFLMGCEKDPDYSQYCVDRHEQFTKYCMKYCYGGYVRLLGTTPMFFETENECLM